MNNITRVWIGDPFEGGHFNGTAFFIDKHTLVTAKHVVLGRDNNLYKNIFLTNTPDGGVTPIDEVILCERDMAIIKVKKAFQIETVSFSNEISLNDEVNIQGYYDKNSSQKSYLNHVSGYQSSEHTYELQNHLTHGLSGSPVFLEGCICGIAKAINSSKNLTYVIPITELCIDIEIDQSKEKTQAPNTQLKSLSIGQRIFSAVYSVRVPFISILVFLTLALKFIFPRLELADAIYALIFIAFVSAKVFEFIYQKIKKDKK